MLLELTCNKFSNLLYSIRRVILKNIFCKSNGRYIAIGKKRIYSFNIILLFIDDARNLIHKIKLILIIL